VRGANTELKKQESKDNLEENNLITKSVLMRIHSECFTGETVSSIRCDCGEQLDRAMRLMASEKNGVILYLRQEGRGIGLLNKMRAYNLQDLGYDTVDANLMLGLPADSREYNIGAAILQDLNISSVKLLTNNPDKFAQLQAFGITITDRVSMVPTEWETKITKAEHNPLATCLPPTLTHPFKSELDGYLRTKVQRMGHMLQPPNQ